ncbi:Putative multidrug resistance protein MdtD [Rhodanobacter lindaniclasticus]
MRLFTASLLFVAASFMCGISQSMGMLLVFRAIQGAVAGPMYPITQSLLISIYPPAKRGMALALLAMVTVVAPIAKPILGGWITENYSWPWIFSINLPIGNLASVVVANQLRGKVEKTERPRIDYVGLISLIIGVGALQIVLDKGNDADSFNSNFIIITSIVSAIAIAIFLIWELTDPDPIVNLRLYRHRNFTTGTLAMVLGYAAFFSIALLVPLWLQQNVGYTTTWAGFATAPIGVLPVLLTFFVGKYATRMDLRLLAAASFLVMGATCFMRSDFYLQIDFYHVAMVQLLRRGRGAVLHAHADDPAVRSAAERDRRRLRIVDLPAHPGRQFLRLDHHADVDPRRGQPPRTTGRAHHPLQPDRPRRDAAVGHGNARTGRQRHRHDYPAELPDLVQRGVPRAGLDLHRPDAGDLAGQAAVHAEGAAGRGRALKGGIEHPHPPSAASPRCRGRKNARSGLQVGNPRRSGPWSRRGWGHVQVQGVGDVADLEAEATPLPAERGDELVRAAQRLRARGIERRLEAQEPVVAPSSASP